MSVRDTCISSLMRTLAATQSSPTTRRSRTIGVLPMSSWTESTQPAAVRTCDQAGRPAPTGRPAPRAWRRLRATVPSVGDRANIIHSAGDRTTGVDGVGRNHLALEYIVHCTIYCNNLPGR